MNLNNRWIGPVLIVGVMIVTSFLTVAAPGLISSIGGGNNVNRPEAAEIPSEPVGPQTVRFDIDGYIIGEELIKIPALAAVNDTEASSIPVLIGITVIVIVAVFLFAGPIALFVMIGQRQTVALGADEEYKASLSSLQNSGKETMKAKNKSQPQTPKPSHERPQVAAWMTGIMVVFMAYMFGYTLGDGIWQGSGTVMANTFATLAIILSWYFFRPQRLVAVEATASESAEENRGGTMWVLLSGAIMMGLGVGLMLVVMSGGDPLPFIIWDPQPTINTEYLQELIAPLLTW